MNYHDLEILPLTLADLPYINHLQPEDWFPIGPYYLFYATSDFCFPIKCVYKSKIVGVGTSILHQKTGWLAHIIVDKEFRNRGIGTMITQSLMDQLRPMAETMTLLATPLGEPVYHKLGFEKDTAYIFLRDGETHAPAKETIQRFHPGFADPMLKLDRLVSGENRIKLLAPHFTSSSIVTENDEVTGFFMPTLGEGLIIAMTSSAGELLLRLRHNTSNRAVVPIENKTAVRFLLANGFVEYRKAIRMWYGKKITWQPDKIYGRIGGNLG